MAIDLSSLKPEDSASLRAKLFDILSPAITQLAPTELTAESTAGEIDKLYPAEQDAETFHWELWTLYFGIVKAVPVDDPRSRLLVAVVDRLRRRDHAKATIWDEQVAVWGDLAMMGSVMREAFDLQPDYSDIEREAATIREWIALNTFAARLLGASLQDWTNFAIWELRDVLENEPKAVSAQLPSALAWLEHAGKVLYSKSLEPRGEPDEAEDRMTKPGPLFQGEPRLTEKRWKFWKERAQALGEQVEDKHLKEHVVKVVESMDRVEDRAESS